MNKYVDQLKLFIGGKASEFNGLVDEEFFNGFLSEYRPQLNLLFELLIWPPLDEETLKQYFETARREYQSMHPIDIKPGSSLKKSKANTWLDQKKQNSISWDYTQRHLDFLYKSGKPKSVIEETEKSSLSILRNLENPEILKPFFIKGLVVGSVQSGKTANFNAVINRGIDVGYKLIIVLSGIMEDLRSQTQLRIENDVVGNGVIDLTSNAKGAKGVGKITRFGNQGDQSIAQVNLITSHTSDFNRALADANFSLDFTNILICKKNTSVLRNLIVWLYEYLEDDKQKHEIPLLIIDDEADNASLNNLGAKGREYASKINGHIRTLLALFDKKVYLGYTATPFANVLQDRNDEPTTKWPIKYRLRNQQEEIRLDQVDNLFPDDFISLLSPPSNYIGPTNFFETILSDNPKIPLIEIVPEEETIAEFPSRVMETSTGVKGVKNFINKESFEKSFDICDFPTYNDYRSQTKGAKAEHDFPKKLPNSLKIAVDCFVLSIALRDSRKSMMIHSSLDNPHNTMLVHISRFTKWQNKTRDLIAQYMNELRVRLENETPNDAGSIYKHLESVWHGHYSYIVENISTYLPSGYTDPFLSPKVFDVVKSFLINAISDIEVKAINNVTKHKLSYENQKPQKVIAVGGNRLSRGFTLEGLTINYFVRNTNYSDTLLQMGRWFGYRPGYLDCCKLFTTQDAIDKFDSTTRAIEELEELFKKMERDLMSPKNFALRVKKHPGTLKITRPSILKNTRAVNWSYQDQLEQTTSFTLSANHISQVWGVFKKDIASACRVKKGIDGFFLYEADYKKVLDLLNKPNNFSKTDSAQMSKFIELCVEKNKLKKWTIAVKATGASSSKDGIGTLSATETGLPGDITLSIRRGPKDSKSNRYRQRFINEKLFQASGGSANILSSGSDLSILLSKDEIIAAEKEFIAEREESYLKKGFDLLDAQRKSQKTNIPERVYRERMSDQDGLFLVYLFDPYYVFLQEKQKDHDLELKEFVEREGINLNTPLVGYAIGFPPIHPDPGGEYVQGDYDLSEDEDGLDENDEEALPEDASAED